MSYREIKLEPSNKIVENSQMNAKTRIKYTNKFFGTYALRLTIEAI